MQTLTTYFTEQNINPLEYGFVIALAIFASMFRTWYDAQKKQKEDDDVTLRDSIFSTFRGIFAGLILIEIAQPALGTDDYNFIFGLLGGLLGNVLIDKSIHLGDTVITGLFGKFEKMIKAVFDSEELPQKKTNEDKATTQTIPVVATSTTVDHTPVIVKPTFDYSKLESILPANIYSEIPTLVSKFEINTPLRLAHFLANCKHESGNFNTLTENLNYSAEGLQRIFGKYFPGDLENEYARQPQRIASRVYANRMKNGDEASGDGWKYRGAGAIQMTGRANYEDFANFMGDLEILNGAEIVATKYPLSSAGFWWWKNNANTIADTDNVEAVCRKVNGGLNGLQDRIEHTEEFKHLLA